MRPHPSIPHSLAFAVVTATTAIASRYLGAIPIHRHDLLEHFLALFALVLLIGWLLRSIDARGDRPTKRQYVIFAISVLGGVAGSILWEGFVNHPGAALAALDWDQMACDWLGIAAAICYWTGTRLSGLVGLSYERMMGRIVGSLAAALLY